MSCDGLTKAESHLGAVGQAGQKAGVSTEQFQVRVASEERVIGTSQNRVSGRGSRVSETRPKTTAAAAKSLQSCPTLCDPIDGGPPGSPVPGILQARILEWVAILFSNA